MMQLWRKLPKNLMEETEDEDRPLGMERNTTVAEGCSGGASRQ